VSESPIEREPPVRRPRQLLSKRQVATLDSLLDAGLHGLRELGFDQLTLREVANRAGVTHTTAYSYFSSKEHLVAEINLRLLRDGPPSAPSDLNAPLGDRLVAALCSASAPYASEPLVARGVLAAMVSQDPDTVRVRDAIGEELARRISEAIGPHADRRVAEWTLVMFSGAMLQAGLGYFSFDEAVHRVAAAAAAWADATQTTSGHNSGGRV
jgi:AcrR family transcriptional regulator